MEKQTRVQRYQELRRNIESMTDYPFENAGPALSEEVDALLKNSESHKQDVVLRHQKKEAKRIRFQRAKEKGFLFKLATAVLVLVLLFVLILFVVLYATGVLS